jgi:uncharacterized protein
MKVIVDTNILVNVFLGPSKTSASYRVLELCLTGKLRPQISNALFSEYEDVLARPTLLAKSPFSAQEIEQVMDAFLSVCSWSRIHFLWRPNLKDEGDNHLIDLAVASGAEFIVTQNLSDLNFGELRFQCRAVRPKELLEIYHGNDHLSHH